MVEYGLAVAAIAIVVIGVVGVIGQKASTALCTTSKGLGSTACAVVYVTNFNTATINEYATGVGGMYPRLRP